MSRHDFDHDASAEDAHGDISHLDSPNEEDDYSGYDDRDDFDPDEDDDGHHHHHHHHHGGADRSGSGAREDSEDPHYGMTPEEVLQAQLRELENFELKDKTIRDEDDPSGKVAYKACCERLDKEGLFFRFPIDSIVEKFENTTNLVLNHCGLGDKGAEALAATLKVNHSITMLSLVDNWITPAGAKFLLEELMGNKNIQHVDLSKNKLGNRASCLGTQVSCGALLGRLLQRNSTITSLILSDNGIGDVDVMKISEGLLDNVSLNLLDLSHNEIGINGGGAIAAVLKQNAELGKLYLAWNRLGSKGSLLVLDGLERNNTIKIFDISWNGVDDFGGELLGRIISGSSALERMYASHNRIGVKGAEAIARGIVGCGSLIELDISENPIREAGCSAIARALREPNTLQIVDMRSKTEISKATVEEIGLTRREKPQLKIMQPPSLFDPPVWVVDHEEDMEDDPDGSRQYSVSPQ
jgi:Ran GTPase-activating protein (RanGAP) involved in mRNA processing and transport